MLAVLGGVGAAGAFAVATLCSSRSSRIIGAATALAWVMLVGLAVLIPVLVIEGRPRGVSGTTAGWLVLGGLTNVLGLLLGYAALRIGKVSMVAPILSTEGAIAALLAVIAGEHLRGGSAAALVMIVAGVTLAAIERESISGERHPAQATLFGVLAALSFGVTLYSIGRVSDDVALAWVLLPARLAGVIFLAVPLALRSSLRMTPRAAPLVIAAGVCEVAGFGLFALGARHGIAIAAVLASLFAAFAAVGAFVLFGERLTRLQFFGVATVVVGVAVLSGSQA